MKNFRKILVFLSMVILLSGCSTIKKGFQPDKRSGEEFLVEKKSPLVMPPDFEKMPEPKDENENKEINQNSLKKLIQNNDSSENNSASSKDFEKSLLNKIKNN